MLTINRGKIWLCPFLILLLVSLPQVVFAGNTEDPRQEPTATGDAAAVATEHPDASEAAITIIKQGGNAVDAAVAAQAVQTVVRPFSNGIGGGGVMNIYLKDEDRFVILDHRVESSENFGPNAYVNPSTGLIYPQDIRISSGMATSVPGVVRAWEESLKKYGKLSMEEVLQPAIKVAEEGFVADENYIRETKENAERFRKFSSTLEIYLDEDGQVPEVGSIMKNPDMAKTFRLIAKQGSKVFYEGEIAAAIIETVNNPPTIEGESVLAGNMTLKDLENYEVLTTEPTHVNYHGYDVYGPPPVSSGGTTIGLALNILENYDLKDLPRTQAMHYFLEASRYSFADRREYLGDPLYTENPTEGLLSKGYAKEISYNILDNKASIGQVAYGNPWPYNENPEKDPEAPENQKHAFYHDFDEIDSKSWDKFAFYRIDTGSSNNPDPETEFSITDSTGLIKMIKPEKRSNAYGRVSPIMKPIKNSEALIRFRMEEIDSDHRLRLFLKSDVWASGSTMPANGYGIELNGETKKLQLIGRKNSNTQTFGSANTNLTYDWQWLRVRVNGDQLAAKLWQDNTEEPSEWSISHKLIDDEKVVNDSGKMLFSVINFDKEKSNRIYFDEMTVDDITDSKEPSEPEKPEVGILSGFPYFQPQTEGAYRISDINIKDLSPDQSTGSYETEIDDRSFLEEEEEPDQSTIHLSVADPDGNVVSYTTTIVSIGGNGMVVSGYGFLLNNALYGRTPSESPDHPNYPRPNFRSLSSMSPIIVMKDKEPVLAMGSPGSATIITTVLQVLINNLDFEMPLPDAIKAPRISQMNNFDAKAEYEGIYSDKIDGLLNELEGMGHTFIPENRIQGIGNVNGLEFLSDGKIIAAAEPTRRGGGSAMAIDFEDLEEPSDDMKKSLQEKVETIRKENLDSAHYTEESWKSFRTALTIAEQLLKLHESQLHESLLDKALSNLELAHTELERK